jgi:hypothetical protein
MKLSINDQLTVSYVFVDNFCKAPPAQAQWRTSNHDAPLFTDAEVLTIALMQGYFGCATLKQTYDLGHDDFFVQAAVGGFEQHARG